LYSLRFVLWIKSDINSYYYHVDLEWKVLYVGKAEDMSSDICLDEILVGPVPVGVNKFILQADAPSPSQLPDGEVVGVTVVLVTCSYREREFVRVGYYVNNEYEGEYDVEKGPVGPIDLSKVTRQILADKPRVTKFPIPWGDSDLVVSQQNDAQVSVSPSSTGMHAEPQDEEDEEGAMQSPSINHAKPQNDMVPATVSSE
jgi:histone chaperone ASF1